MGFPVTKENLCASVQKLIESADMESCKATFTNNRPGKKWYHGFLKRHKVLPQKHTEYVNRARGSVTEEIIRNWFHEVSITLNDMDVLNDPNRIFNMDETSFFLAPKGELLIGPRGHHVYDESCNSDKDNVITLFAVNAAGKFAPPLTLFKYARIPASLVKAAPPNWGIGKTENGWMTGESFFEYITNVFDPFLKEAEIPRLVVIFLDGHCSHLTLHLSRYCRENQIILVALLPNSTHILQTLDVAVFGPMKKMWKKIVQKWRFENNGTEISKSDVPSVLSQIIIEPKMMENIRAGFRATGLFPFNVNNVDYSKIVVRSIPASTTVQTSEELQRHFSYIEKQIDPVLLDEFRATKRRNNEWEGNQEALLLFKFSRKIADEVEMHGVSGNTDDILQIA
ncbi:uncharacterized protein LOC126417125 [Schistocerca serialis cubense]|uniref:uncharacterized protein LOC126417125 n=1 Tax=Schistocerca serialis cubense TaxID=2023355 RepID=UPI00214E1348|nr:uncharacterized protein LOC126417125 [Schistocerca serialis cubense]